MSWMRIEHETIYRYRKPVRFAEHRLVIRPREGHDIRVEEMTLEIEPHYSLEWSRDVFGNSVATVHLLEPADVLRFHSRVLLGQTQDFPSATTRPALPATYPMEYEPEELIMSAAYRESIYPGELDVVRDWVERTIQPNLCESAECVVALVTEAVHEVIRYNRREERGVQTPAETLRAGSGSCRDQSTFLLEALRVLGFPARFVSGYLDCKASEAGWASTHAWVEAYLPDTGWVGFDPTLNERTANRHVVVGVSNHPRGVMPIVGSYFGMRDDFVSLDVAVKTERFSEEPALAAEPE